MSLFAQHPHPPVLSIVLSPKTQLDITLSRSIFAADRTLDSLNVFDCETFSGFFFSLSFTNSSIPLNNVKTLSMTALEEPGPWTYSS